LAQGFVQGAKTLRKRRVVWRIMKKPAAKGAMKKTKPMKVSKSSAPKKPKGGPAAKKRPAAKKLSALQAKPMPDSFFSKEFLMKHIESIMGFYEGRVEDATGGFFQSFYRDGKTYCSEFRHLVSSTRMVINFMLVGKLFNRPELIKLGRHGLDYVEKVHYVAEKGSYAWTVSNHTPNDMTQQAYGYAFLLAAHAAAYANGESDKANLDRIFNILEERFWLPERGAYLDTISAEGVVDNLYRGQNSNMHMCEAMIAAYEATKEQRYLDRAKILATTFTKTLASKAGGFVYEHFTVDFEVDKEYNKNDPTNIYRPWGFQPGHQNEWAKNLLNIHRYEPSDWMLEKAKFLFDGAWNKSYDAEYGGLVYGFDFDGNWCDDNKYFWVQGESLATAALLFQATRDASYLEKYVNLWHYVWKHWVDHEYGGWLCFKMTRQNERDSDLKAIAGGKCDYHTMVSCIEALRAFQ